MLPQIIPTMSDVEIHREIAAFLSSGVSRRRGFGYGALQRVRVTAAQPMDRSSAQRTLGAAWTPGACNTPWRRQHALHRDVAGAFQGYLAGQTISYQGYCSIMRSHRQLPAAAWTR